MSNVIGDRVAGWRVARGLTQAQLAVRSGVPQAAVSAIESFRRDLTVRTLQRLAAAMELSPGTLLDRDPPRPGLTRLQVDAISRAIVTGTRRLPPAHVRLADACAAEVLPTLEACRAPGAARARRRGPRSLLAAERRFGRETVDLILGRIDKHLGALPA